MTEQGLRIRQDEYNLKKYNQSTIARTDMSGKCDFCNGCLFRTDILTCVMDHETRDKYSVCARNGARLEEEANATRKNSTRTGKRTNKKGPNV